MRVDQGFTESDKAKALIAQDPYKMDKGQCIAQLEKVQLFGDDEEYYRNEAPLYELQFLIFDWAARFRNLNEELYGVRYIYGKY